MAVLKHTSPTASPSAPKPWPSMIVPSARTRRPVTRGASQWENTGRADLTVAGLAALVAIKISPEGSRLLGGSPVAGQGCAPPPGLVSGLLSTNEVRHGSARGHQQQSEGGDEGRGQAARLDA